MSKLEAQINTIRDGLSEILKRLDKIERVYEELPAKVKAEVELNPEDLDALPWRLYKEGHRSGWVFSDQEGAEKLLELIKESKEDIHIGNFKYHLSHGDNRSFISRNPVE